jgi:hypothetical protein
MALERSYKMTSKAQWAFNRRGGRVVECGSLENCCTFGYREFESHPLRSWEKMKDEV